MTITIPSFFHCSFRWRYLDMDVSYVLYTHRQHPVSPSHFIIYIKSLQPSLHLPNPFYHQSIHARAQSIPSINQIRFPYQTPTNSSPFTHNLSKKNPLQPYNVTNTLRLLQPRSHQRPPHDPLPPSRRLRLRRPRRPPRHPLKPRKSTLLRIIRLDVCKTCFSDLTYHNPNPISSLTI